MKRWFLREWYLVATFYYFAKANFLAAVGKEACIRNSDKSVEYKNKWRSYGGG
jgi:hypothetical protein